MVHPEQMRRASLLVEALAKAGISSILFDSSALTIYGAPVIMSEYALIVPDDLVTESFEACRKLDFVVKCDKAPNCMYRGGTYKGQVPAEHLHISAKVSNKYGPAGDRICLYQMRQIFHPQRLPNPATDGPDLMLASDSRIPHRVTRHGCGPYPTEWYPVPILTPRCFAETLIRLCVRYADEPFENHNYYHWNSLLGLFSYYVAGDWPDFFQYTELGPHFRWFWKKCWVDKPGLNSDAGFKQLQSKMLPWPVDSALTHLA